MIVVHLYGLYKKRFGAKFELSVKTLADAIRLLEANFPGKFAKMVEKDAFYICQGKTVGDGHINIENPDMLKMECGDWSHFHLIPKAQGGSTARRKGLGSILLGAVILGVSFMFGFTPGIYAGLSLILGGASLLLTPDVAAENEDKAKSYSFSGPVNINTEGATKPVIYGRVRAGSVTAGGSISVADYTPDEE